MQAGPLASQASLSPALVICGGISLALGQTLSIKPINLPLPIFLSADKQNNGKQVMVDHCFFQSHLHFIFIQFAFVKIFFHQGFIISGNGFNQFFMQFSAFSFSSSGIGSFSGLPPVSLNLYIVIRSTSMIS